MPNFTIGDTVKVLSYDEICNRTENYRDMHLFTKAGEYFTSEMEPFCGTILTIKRITEKGKYTDHTHFSLRILVILCNLY